MEVVSFRRSGAVCATGTPGMLGSRRVRERDAAAECDAIGAAGTGTRGAGLGGIAAGFGGITAACATGGLDSSLRKDIGQTMNSRSANYQTCYADALERDAGTEG